MLRVRARARAARSRGATRHGGTHGSPVGPLLQERAAIGQCGLPSPGTWWIDFASLDTERELSRAGVIVGASTGTYPARLRAAGAKTVYWDMYLNRRVGHAVGAGGAGHDRGAANSLFDFAADPERLREADHRAQRALRGAPRDAVDGEQQRYRENVLAFVRQLASRGARPFLLHLDPALHRQRRGGRLVARGREGRRSRAGGLLRRAVALRAGAGRGQPPDPRGDARPPLALPRDRDPRVAARRRARVPDRPRRRRARGPAAGRGLVRGGQVAGARRAADRRRVPDRLGLVVGVGRLQRADGDDEDKPSAMCVYLWTRAPGLCDGLAAAGPAFRASRTEGQIRLPASRKCGFVGGGGFDSGSVGVLQQVTGDRESRAHDPARAHRRGARGRRPVLARPRGGAGGDRVALRRQRRGVPGGAGRREGERGRGTRGARRRAAAARARADDARPQPRLERGLDLLPVLSRPAHTRRPGEARAVVARVQDVRPRDRLRRARGGLHAPRGPGLTAPRARRDVHRDGERGGPAARLGAARRRRGPRSRRRCGRSRAAPRSRPGRRPGRRP